jgi:hypothetical protein
VISYMAYFPNMQNRLARPNRPDTTSPVSSVSPRLILSLVSSLRCMPLSAPESYRSVAPTMDAHLTTFSSGLRSQRCSGPIPRDDDNLAQ